MFSSPLLRLRGEDCLATPALNLVLYRAIVEVEKVPSREEQYHDGLGSYGGIYPAGDGCGG
jgi:hypothetical protein